MTTVIRNACIIPNGADCVHGSVAFSGGRITALSRGELAGDSVIDAGGELVLPGFIDTHLHGSLGYDFIRSAAEAVSAVGRALPAEGTTAFLASLTVISHADLLALLRDYAALDAKTAGAEFLGVHSEGPFLSKEYKALMDERYLRDANAGEYAEMIAAAGGRLKTMTFSPAVGGVDALLRLSAEASVRLMIGHTACTCEQALAALDGGAAGFTHLYNAMTQHLHRTPGAVTAALLHRSALCELIVDGFHVAPDVVRATYRSIGPERICLITDAMLGKGMPDGEYIFSGLRCRKTGHTVQVIKTGRIAGSCITMLHAVRFMREFTGCTVNDIVQMASVNPARSAGVSDRKGTLAVGKDADLLLMTDDLRLLRTFVGGEEKYRAEA